MTYDEARQYLEEISHAGIVLGLDSMRELLAKLDNPQEKQKYAVRLELLRKNDKIK